METYIAKTSLLFYGNIIFMTTQASEFSGSEHAVLTFLSLTFSIRFSSRRLFTNLLNFDKKGLLTFSTENSIFVIETLVGECRLHAVLFFGNLAADGTHFY